MTTKSGVGVNCRQYAFWPSLRMWSRTCRACSASRRRRSRPSRPSRTPRGTRRAAPSRRSRRLPAGEPHDDVGAQDRPSSSRVVGCSSKSQCSSIPAISITRRSWISPQRPRTCGARERVDEVAGLAAERSALVRRCARPRSAIAVRLAGGRCSSRAPGSRPCSSDFCSGATYAERGLRLLGERVAFSGAPRSRRLDARSSTRSSKAPRSAASSRLRRRCSPLERPRLAPRRRPGALRVALGEALAQQRTRRRARRRRADDEPDEQCDDRHEGDAP